MTAAPGSNLTWLLLAQSNPEAAASYAANGWAVFPCCGKTPLTAHGFKDASADAAQVNRWWRAHLNANIGWPLPSGWFALDVEPRHGGDDELRLLQREHGPLPLTLRARTGSGGEHWMFTLPEGTVVKNRAGIVPGIDVRAVGGYLVVAPSTHPETGQRYRWQSVIAPVPAPPWLLGLVASAPLLSPSPVEARPRIAPQLRTIRGTRWAASALHSLAQEVANAVEGTRNSTLNRAAFRAGQLVGGGLLDEVEARAALSAAACSCGLPEREIAAVLR